METGIKGRGGGKEKERFVRSRESVCHTHPPGSNIYRRRQCDDSDGEGYKDAVWKKTGGIKKREIL